MGKQVVEPRFIQIGYRAIAVAQIVSVEILPVNEGNRVDVYMVVPVRHPGVVDGWSPNLHRLSGEDAGRFLDWWNKYDGVRVL